VPGKILIAAANYWTSPYQVGSHHYARVFAENGWEVMFVSDPVSPLHFLAAEKKQVSERYGIYKGRVGSGNKNIDIYVPMALFTPNEKPFFRSAFVTNSWHRFTIPDVVKHVVSEGFGEVDVLWFDSIIQYFWMGSIKHRISILRVSDVMDAFRKNTKNVKKVEEKLKEQVDYIAYTASSLKSYLAGFESKAFYMPNGVDINHFLDANRQMPQDLKDIPKPIAIYVGAIDEWFGLDFMIEVAKKLSGISFVFIGEPRIDVSRLSGLGNVYFLGRKPYSLVPAYLYNSNAGIIVFDVNHPVVKSVNPIKLYEYMACGLPVVATRWEELDNIGSPAYLADNPHDFSVKLERAIKVNDNIMYVDFARKNSWTGRFKSLRKYSLEGDVIVGHVDKKQRVQKNDEYSKSPGVIGHLEDIKKIITDNNVQRVIVSSPEFKYFEILEILESLKGMDITVLIFPGFFEFSLRRLSIREIGGVPLMQVSNIGFFGFNLFMKNCIDYILGIICFIIFIPIYLVVGAAIKLDSKGPVFFKQKRLTKDCREFYMYKFRSMYSDAEERLKDLMALNEADGPIFKMKKDPRITRVGKFIRKFSIDELPQIINVLKGELSMVGPRPPLPAEVEKYDEWEAKRMNVKQGLTGLWQISGRSDLSFEEMARLDLYYIQNWSIEMDIKILLKTIPVMLFGKGAY